MLTCSGCRVARFCSTDLQKMVSNKALQACLYMGRHKDICGVLGKWRQVVKDGVAPYSCTAECTPHGGVLAAMIECTVVLNRR